MLASFRRVKRFASLHVTITNHQQINTIMSTKKDHKKATGVNWPQTQARQAANAVVEKEQLEGVAAVAAISQIMTAASAIPMPMQKKLLAEVAAEASKGMIGGKEKTANGKKRAWKEHADKYFETNEAWGEVNGIYASCLDVLRTSVALSPLLREIKLLKKVKNVKLLTRNIKAINTTTATLAETLAKTRALHADKQGGSQDQIEMVDACNAFSQYVDFMERYDSALMPLIVHASEQLEEALDLLSVEEPELALSLKNNMTGNLHSIRTIVHELTGADPIVTPGTQPVTAAPANAEAVA